MKNSHLLFVVVFCSITIISCSSEDDAAFKEGKIASDISEVDQLEAPSGSVLINNGDTSTTSNLVNLTLSASDAGMVSDYYISETNSAPSSTASEWVSITNTQNYSATVDFTISSDWTLGEYPKTVYAWFKDTSENVSSVASDSITLVIADTAAPSSSNITINNDNSSTSNALVTLAIAASDNYGISAYYVSEISTTPSSSNSGWTSVTSSTNFSTSISFTLTGASSAGSYSRTVYVWFKDEAGNISSSASDAITFIVNDTTSPSNPTIIVNNGDSSTNSTVVTLALSAIDNVGITAYYASETSTTPASNASGWDSVTSNASYSDNVSFSLASAGSAGTFSRTVYIWFKDATGNVSGNSSDAINLVVTDTTAPANPSISINSGADNTTFTDVTLTISATDSEGVMGYYASESNTSPANNASGWTSVTSSTNYSDNVSFSFSNVSSFGTFSRTVYVWYKDAAGNISLSASDGISLIKNVTNVSPGANHTCATLKSKKVYCWGRNDYTWMGGGGTGQLGDGTTAHSSTPVLVKNIENASLVSAGTYHNCALLTDGGIKCWGWGLGYGTSGSNSTPTSISGISSAISVSTSVGEFIDQGTCAMLSDGTVKCWGNLYLGNGLTSGSNSPVTVTGISNAASVSTGGNHMCSSLDDGTIKCWGRNDYGQLGTGGTYQRTTPTFVNGIDNAKAVSAGHDFTCALLLDGTIKCWGAGWGGRLGNGSDPSKQRTPVSVNGISSAISVSTGYAHACAVLSGGTIKCWGYNLYGQLGNGTKINSAEPVTVSGISSAISVSAGHYSTCALLSGGGVKCWGYGTYGQLGNGLLETQTQPVDVEYFGN